MASRYLLNEEQKIRDNYELKMQAEKDAGETRKKELEKQKSDIFDSGCGTACVIGIVIAIVVWILAHSFTEGLGAGLVFMVASAIIVPIYSGLKKGKMNRKISECTKQTEEKIKKAEKQRDEEIKLFGDIHRRKCEERTKYFIQSTQTSELEEWLCQKFSAQIDGIDRRKHVKELRASYHFTVESTGIVGDNGKFDFIIECYQVLNDFYDQIGLARALCKKVQYTMQKKYELDSTGTKAKITVSGNDNHMCLEYYASNGEYEFAKKI